MFSLILLLGTVIPEVFTQGNVDIQMQERKPVAAAVADQQLNRLIQKPYSKQRIQFQNMQNLQQFMKYEKNPVLQSGFNPRGQYGAQAHNVPLNPATNQEYGDHRVPNFNERLLAEIDGKGNLAVNRNRGNGFGVFRESSGKAYPNTPAVCTGESITMDDNNPEHLTTLFLKPCLCDYAWNWHRDYCSCDHLPNWTRMHCACNLRKNEDKPHCMCHLDELSCAPQCNCTMYELPHCPKKSTTKKRLMAGTTPESSDLIPMLIKLLAEFFKTTTPGPTTTKNNCCPVFCCNCCPKPTCPPLPLKKKKRRKGGRRG